MLIIAFGHNATYLQAFDYEHKRIGLIFNPADYGILSFSRNLVFPHPRKQGYDFLIDLKFGQVITGIRLLRMQNFRKLAVRFLEN